MPEPKKGTILLSKDGSVGEALCLNEDAAFVTSGAILHLLVKDAASCLPEYLALALNSKAVRMQAERDAGGSIILHWRMAEIEQVVVPMVPVDVQEAIVDFLRRSVQLRGESKKRLDLAKAAIDLAIEAGEESALLLLENGIGPTHPHRG